MRRTDFRPISFLPTFYPLSVCQSPLTLFDTMYLNTFKTVPYLLTFPQTFWIAQSSSTTAALLYCPSMSHYFFAFLFEHVLDFSRNKTSALSLRWKRWIANQSDFSGPCSERSNTPFFIFIFYSFFFSYLRSNVRRFKKASFPLSFQNFHGDCGHGRHGRIPIYRPKPYHQDSIALKSLRF